MNNENSVYFDAARYASERLGEIAPKHFQRIQYLSQTNTLDELRGIIDSWSRGLKPSARKIAAGLWKPGSAWGNAVLVQHERGVFWKLKCHPPCNKFFSMSMNDSVPDWQRCCPECFAEELSKRDPAKLEKAKTIAAMVLEWYDAHDKLIWREINRTCRKRRITDETVKNELHCLVWLRISEKAATYKDIGFKVSSWLATVAHNALINFFEKDWHRQELAPMTPFADDAGNYGVPNPNPPCAAERVPAKKVASQGASPHDGELNLKQAAWDSQQGRDWGAPA